MKKNSIIPPLRERKAKPKRPVNMEKLEKPLNPYEPTYNCYNCGHHMPYIDAIEGDGTCPKCGKLIKGEDEFDA